MTSVFTEKYQRGRPSPDETAAIAEGVGRVLRRAREDASVSQRALASRSGVSRFTIKALEHGQRRPRASLLRALAQGIADPPDVRRPAPAAGERAERLAAELVDAAGPHLVPDTEHSGRRREQRTAAARRSAAPPPHPFAAMLTAGRSRTMLTPDVEAILARGRQSHRRRR